MSQGSTGRVLLMVPTLNEERGIRKVLRDVPKDIAVLVVGGGSTDDTVEVARQYRVRAISQKFGRGKGCGVRTGMEYFLSSKDDVLCMIDGDGSNGPEELPKMIEAMQGEKSRCCAWFKGEGETRKRRYDSVYSLFQRHCVAVSWVAIPEIFYRCANGLLGIQQESG